MTFKIGAKVRVNDNYGAEHEEIDDSITQVRGSEGVVTYVDNLIHVKATETEYEDWKRGDYLFFEEELDLLEEGHPLTKESVKS